MRSCAVLETDLAREVEARQQQAQTIVALELRLRSADEAAAAHKECMTTLRAELATAQASAVAGSLTEVRSGGLRGRW